MVFYFLVLFGIYFLFMLMILAGWIMATQFTVLPKKSNQQFSVIIPFRNEAKNLPVLLSSIEQVVYPAQDCEWIFVDDHSDDHSVLILEEWKRKNDISCSILSLTNGTGKKMALQKGIDSARFESIATTDADCNLPSDWLQSINAAFQEHHELMIGTVQMEGSSFWSRLQQMEFFSVMSVTLSSWAWGKPTMCNGANLAFRKAAFNSVGGYDGNLHIASGDDEFLLRKVVARFGEKSIGHHAGSVITQAQPTVKAFVEQRIRWASKWRINSSLTASILAILVLMVQLSWYPLLFWYFRYEQSVVTFIILAKVFTEFLLLFSVSAWFKTRFHLLSFFLLQLLYSPYVIIVALLSRWHVARWKDRPII